MIDQNIIDSMNKIWFTLLQNGSISLFYKSQVLNKYINQIQNEGFEVVTFDCSGWNNEKSFLIEAKEKLSFPNFFGNSFDAFNDCLSDYETHSEGLVLVFNEFDSYFMKYPGICEIILDIVQRNSWYFLLTGRKLLAFVQSNDVHIERNFDNIGAMPPNWNPEEWLDKNRGV